MITYSLRNCYVFTKCTIFCILDWTEPYVFGGLIRPDGFMTPDFIRRIGLAAKHLSTRGGEEARHVHINAPQPDTYPSNAIGKFKLVTWYMTSMTYSEVPLRNASIFNVIKTAKDVSEWHLTVGNSVMEFSNFIKNFSNRKIQYFDLCAVLFILSGLF